MRFTVLALDIGGANLKAAHSMGVTRLEPFALWKNPGALGQVLKRILESCPRPDRLAVTMTGELCDCYETKRQGVQAILDAVEFASAGTPIWVWRTDGKLVDLATARADPLPAAAANWLALATFAGRMSAGGAALVIDIGSTTTDIIPILKGRPVPRGRTDVQRLGSRELVYTGVRRTPVCALLGSDVAAEWFATTLDAYLVLGELPENSTGNDTADGRPETVPAAHARLARMLCADSESCPREETYSLAAEVHHRQRRLVRGAIESAAHILSEAPETFILAGSGEFLGRQAIDEAPALAGRRLSLSEELGSDISHSACAYALMVLAQEQLDGQ